MTTLRDQLEVCARRSGISVAIVPVLIEQAPWLDGTTEVSEALAPQLLSEPFGSLSLGAAEIDLFISAYNKEVRAAAHPSPEAREAAYSACLRALAPFGKDYELGGRDFWVFPESFADRPSITVFPGFTLPPEAISALQAVATAFAHEYTAIEVITEEGELIALCPSRDG